MSKKMIDLNLYFFALFVVVIALLCRIVSIAFYVGDYDIIFHTISQNGNLYVDSELNLVSVLFFAIYCFLTAALSLIVYYSLKGNPKLHSNWLFKINMILGVLFTIIIPFVPSDLLLIPHTIVAMIIFVTTVIATNISAYYIRRYHVTFLVIIQNILFVLLVIVGSIQILVNPAFPTGIFEKAFIYFDMLYSLVIIYYLLIDAEKHKIRPKRKR